MAELSHSAEAVAVSLLTPPEQVRHSGPEEGGGRYFYEFLGGLR